MAGVINIVLPAVVDKKEAGLIGNLYVVLSGTTPPGLKENLCLGTSISTSRSLSGIKFPGSVFS